MNSQQHQIRMKPGTLILTGACWMVLVAGGLADEPAASRWKYAPELLRPFWVGDTVEGESVLFIKDAATGTASSELLFPVRKIIAVRNSARDATYESGRDYTWESGSRKITLPAGSRIVSRTSRELRRPAKSQKYELTHRDGDGEIFFGAKLEYHDMQTCITYTHEPDLWKPAVPRLAGQQLPGTLRKLRDRQPLVIVSLGDSISSGCNASGWAQGAPFQPPYQELLRQHLAATYQSRIELPNLSVSGTDTAWGLSMVDKVIDARPDLVLIAFGMNDSAGRSAKDYEANIEKTMAAIRQKRPGCEFILIASMLGNRDWIRLRHDAFPEYRDALANLCGPGVALADLTTIWTEFFKWKKDWDLTGNGVNHPNDFGHRVYAHVLAALLIAPEDS